MRKNYHIREEEIAKQRPTITVCQLSDGEYKRTFFRGDNLIQSKAFPELKLTASQIFQSATS